MDAGETEVEEILSSVAARTVFAEPPGRARANHALWLCACVSGAGPECPTWLIHDTEAGGVAWGLAPDHVTIESLVSARLIAGGHVHPSEVLAWLRGEATMPYGGDGGDPAVTRELGRLLGIG